VAFVSQVAAVLVGGVLLLLATSLLNTGRFPPGLRAVPWWGWLTALVFAAVAIVILVIRRRNTRAVHIGYIDLRDPDEPRD